MILSHRHKFIFLKTRKTAGTSIEIALSQVCGPDDVLTPISPKDEALRAGLPGPGAQNWKPAGMRLNRLERFIGQITGHRARGRGFYNHVRAAEVKRIVGPDIWESYFKFSVERNPWDRQVSLYYWRYPDAETRPPFEDFLTSRRWRKRVDNFKIYTLDGALAVDYMMRYESLGADFAAALEKIGISEPLSLAQAKGASRAGGRDYRDYYTDETRELVGEWYKDEIALFGYRF